MGASVQRFLVVRLSSLGDIVHALPAVAALGDSFPSADVYWAVETRHAVLLEGNPYVRRVIKFDTLGWRTKLRSAATLNEIAGSLTELRALEYEAAIDFQGLWKSAVIAWLSRAQKRVGFAGNWLREPAAGVLYSDRVSPHGRTHVVEMNLALVERLGGRTERWQFPLPHNPSDDSFVEQQLAALGAQDFMVINPGGGWKTKSWAPANYAELLRGLESKLSWKILLTGSAEEEPLIQSILQQAGTRRASYFPSTIVQFIALVRRARLFIGGDTGPLHLAAAVGIPIVAIYGPTDPKRNGPFSAADIALSNRGPINHTRRTENSDYLPGISVSAVLAAIHERCARAYG